MQVHGPGFSKILLGDDVVDDWEEYLDLMVDSIYLNSGRGCINCSGIWASRHTEEIAAGDWPSGWARSNVKPPEIRDAGLAAFTVPGRRQAVWSMIEAGPEGSGVTRHDGPVRCRGWSSRNAAPTCGP